MRALILLLLFAFLAGCSKEEPEKKAPLFSDLGGNLSFPITTSSELAQKYFNQGLTLAYGFNHAEAFRSFKRSGSSGYKLCDGLLGNGFGSWP